MLLKKRTIVFLCHQCRRQYDTFTTLPTDGASLVAPSTAELKDLLVNTLNDLLPGILERKLGDITAYINLKIDEVKTAVETLRDSDRALIGLVGDGLQLPRGAGSVSVEQSQGISGKEASVAGTATHSSPPSTQVSVENRSTSPAGNAALVGSRRVSNFPGSSGRVPVSARPSAGQSSSGAGNSTKRTPYSTVLGSRRVCGAKISAASILKKTSILVGRLDLGVAKEDLTDYLKSTFGDTECFLVEEQKVRSGEYRSFRVEARLDLLEKLLCPTNWPEGVLIKKFRFFRGGTTGPQ